MVSIIICSVNKVFLQNVSDNIALTIGTNFELLIWDNMTAKKGLCAVYNEMASRAKYPYLCFLHEDILFETHGWGKILEGVFAKDPSIGLIGVAGSKYKSKSYSGWHTGIPEFDSFNITHRHRSSGESVKMWNSAEGNNDIPHRVVCIDGVLMACRKEVWEREKFDDRLIKGFHFYDIDFSIRVAGICDVVVVMDIDIVHITFGGDYGDKWVEEAMYYHQKKGYLLPVSYVVSANSSIENRIAANCLDRLKTEKMSLANKRKWIITQKLYLAPSLWYAIVRFLVYEPFRPHRLHRYLRKL